MKRSRWTNFIFRSIAPFVFVVVLLCSGMNVVGQNEGITFTNVNAQKAVHVATGEFLKLQYTGYLKQQEATEGFVEIVTDKTITIALQSKPAIGLSRFRTVQLKDITGFRRLSFGEMLFTPVAKLLAATGGIALYIVLRKQSDWNDWAVLGTGAGYSLATTYVLNRISRKRIKYFMKNGWSIVPIKPTPPVN